MMARLLFALLVGASYAGRKRVHSDGKKSNVDLNRPNSDQNTCPSDPFVMYQMGTNIGSGGHGLVYEVTDISDNKQYVLKLPKMDKEKHIVEEINNQLMMKNEWQIPEDSPIVLSKCEYVPPVEGDTSSKPWISFPYFPSGDLLAHLRKKRLELSQIKSIGSDILQALKLIHDKDYVLNDLKIENIVVYFSIQNRRLVHRAKLIDLGLMAPEKKISTAGTLQYMAPEKLLMRLKQKGFTIGKATDMWSFGMLMFAAYSGRYPFRTQKERTIEMNIDLLKQILNSFRDEIINSPELSHDHRNSLIKYYSKNSAKSTVPRLKCNINDDFYAKCKELSDLISKVLRFNPGDRISAAEALAHKFFQ